MREPDRPYIIAFSCLLKIGPVRFAKLRAFFSTIEEAWRASREQLQQAGLPQDAVDELLEERSNIDVLGLSAHIANLGISIVTLDDDSYPDALRHIHATPFLLYYRGQLPPSDAIMIAVVGTREPSTYGRVVAPGIVEGLSRAGVVVVSGLALGIDSLAHEATLKSGTPTIAVIGSGLDEASIYPPQNKILARKIIESGGAILSEYPPGVGPRKHHFPARNRIVAGMSRGVLVVEAKQRSGALITAYCALEQNRDVFAVPGPINSEYSDGPNDLLKRGAVVVTESMDILRYYGMEPADNVDG